MESVANLDDPKTLQQWASVPGAFNTNFTTQVNLTYYP